MTRVSDIDMIHPAAKMKFIALRDSLQTLFLNGKTKTHFKVFETYRSPLRQQIVKAQGNSKAGPFESAHQFGLAVDFVPVLNDGKTWSWDPMHDWDLLRREATRLGLHCTIDWDRPHVEHDLWKQFRQLTRR